MNVSEYSTRNLHPIQMNLIQERRDLPSIQINHRLEIRELHTIQMNVC